MLRLCCSRLRPISTPLISHPKSSNYASYRIIRMFLLSDKSTSAAFAYTPSVIENSALPSARRRGSLSGKSTSSSLTFDVSASTAGGSKSLLDSWTSLEMFQRTNRGRISMLPPNSPPPATMRAPASVTDAVPAKYLSTTDISEPDALMVSSNSMYFSNCLKWSHYSHTGFCMGFI